MRKKLATNRKDAVALGDTHYFTGVPCKRGHLARRHVKRGNCLECLRLRSLEADKPAQRAANRRSFWRHRESRRQMRADTYQRNRDNELAGAATYREQHKEQVAAHDLKRKRQLNTGFTPEMFAERLSDQDHKCAICRTKVATKGRHTHADHCHKTGRPRGVLCRACNLGLGFFRDDPNVLRLAAHYVESWGTERCVDELNRKKVA